MINYRYLGILSFFIILALTLGAVSAHDDFNITDAEIADSNQDIGDGLKMESEKVELKDTTFMTKENVIFLEPIMTSELIDVHKRFIEYMKDFDGELNQYYDIDKWMPHCTISIRLSDEELFKGIELLKEIIKLPIKVRVEKIDIINYPFNQIMMLDLEK